jgi:hypothetical protein
MSLHDLGVAGRQPEPSLRQRLLGIRVLLLAFYDCDSPSRGSEFHS